jgi:mycothiol synthase
VSATVVVRAPREGEAAEVARVINAASRAEYGVDDVNETEIRRWFSHPVIDVERDVFVADENGRPTAYADVGDEGNRGEQFWIDLRLPPDASQTAGEALLAAAERRVAERAAERPHDGGRRMIGWVSSTNERLGRLLQGAGFRLYRHSFRMSIDLGDALPEPRVPDGIEVRTFAAGEERATFEAVDEAFEDTWDHMPGIFEEWRHWAIERDDFDPTLWWLAWEGHEIAGACLCRPHETEADMGWVSSLGVRRPWRRRGLARALLALSFQEFKRRGFARVALGVDADSLTGANRLYESAGMRPIRRSDLYQKDVA